MCILFHYPFLKFSFGRVFVAVWALLWSRWVGALFVAVSWLLTAVAPLAAEHRLRMRGFSSCSTWAQYLWLPGFRAEAQQLGLMGLVALQHGRPWIREPSLLHRQADSLPLSHQGSPHYPFNGCKSCSNVPFLMPNIGNLFLFSWFFVSLGKVFFFNINLFILIGG